MAEDLNLSERRKASRANVRREYFNKRIDTISRSVSPSSRYRRLGPITRSHSNLNLAGRETVEVSRDRRAIIFGSVEVLESELHTHPSENMATNNHTQARNSANFDQQISAINERIAALTTTVSGMAIQTQQQSTDLRDLANEVNRNAAGSQRITEQLNAFAQQMSEFRQTTEAFQATVAQNAAATLNFQQAMQNSMVQIRTEGQEQYQRFTSETTAHIARELRQHVNEVSRLNQNARLNVGADARIDVENFQQELANMRGDVANQVENVRRDIQNEIGNIAAGIQRVQNNTEPIVLDGDDARREMFAINEICKKIPDVTLTSDGMNNFVSTVDILYDLVNADSELDVRKFETSIRLKLVGCSIALRNVIRDKHWGVARDHLLRAYCFANNANDTQNKINTLAQKTNENIFDYGCRARHLLVEMTNHIGTDANPGMVSLIEKNIRKSFIRGLSDGKLRGRLKIMPHRDLNELIDSTVEQSEYISEQGETTNNNNGNNRNNNNNKNRNNNNANNQQNGNANTSNNNNNRGQSYDNNRQHNNNNNNQQHGNANTSNNNNRGQNYDNGGRGNNNNGNNRNNNNNGNGNRNNTGNGNNANNNNAGRSNAYPILTQNPTNAPAIQANIVPTPAHCIHHSAQNHLN